MLSDKHPLTPLRALPNEAGYKAGDVLVVFGEIFARGYANGLVDEAERRGLTVIRSTVGRRDEKGMLRALTEEEAAAHGSSFISIPLEAGFDLEPCDQDGTTPASQLAGMKLGEWENAKLDWAKIESSRAKATARFRQHVESHMKELESRIPNGANVIFAHIMAGGVPRAKILMPVMNWVFKGTGDRHLSSEKFWNSELGRLTSMNFDDVSAGTFAHLLDLSSTLRARIEKNGGSARFVAYGYHGTEVLIGNEYQWQTYAPYLQGWAKRHLENHARKAWADGVHATVYNCPEILTNSSGIFVGVEVPLYPFVTALKKEAAGQPKITAVIEKCAALLKPEHSLDEVKKLTDRTLASDELQHQGVFDQWPQHNTKQQMETLIAASQTLIDMHKDTKQLMTFPLSEEIFKATGYVIYHDSWRQQAPVLWLGHDVLAKALGTGRTL